MKLLKLSPETYDKSSHSVENLSPNFIRDMFDGQTLREPSSYKWPSVCALGESDNAERVETNRQIYTNTNFIWFSFAQIFILKPLFDNKKD